MNEKQLQDQIEALEIKLKHLENDFIITKRDYEKTTQKYYEILSELKEKNQELENLKHRLETMVEERTRELNRSRKKLEITTFEQQMMLDSSPAMIFYKDRNNTFLRVNKAFSEITGLERSEIIGKSGREICNRISGDNLCNDSELMKNGKPVLNRTDRLQTGKGERWILIDKFPYRNEVGKIDGVIGFALNITMRIKFEQELHESEKRLRQFMRTANDIIIAHDLTGKITYINEAGLNFFGYDESKIYASNITDVVTDSQIELIRKKLESGSSSGDQKILYETEYENSKGQTIPVEVSSVPLKENKKTTGIFIIARDITDRVKAEQERKYLEEQLFQAQKMESIGWLAGGIAHDFNNILTSIMGFAEVVEEEIEDKTSPGGLAAEIIIKSTERAANLTQQLLGFARGGKYNPVPLNINELIRNVMNLSEKVFPKNIILYYDFTDEIATVEADETQLEQVFTNLTINARDAMTNGGTISIKTENILIDGQFTKTFPEFLPGQYIKITISDSGIGMPKEISDRIFEPFFSTKAQGKGTGLGLATVYGIIKNHKGQIRCESEVGNGTSFIIYLPTSSRKVEKRSIDKGIIRGKETIFVIDDEENIRKLLRGQLKKLGYKVITARDGLEAVELYKTRQNDIDLVLLDMIMPKISGRETFVQLKQINPEVCAFLISGFSQDHKAAEILEEGVKGFIQKPFRIHILSKILSDYFSKA